MNLGNKIKKYREKNNITQKEIARILEVESGTISKYESGKIEPSVKTVIKLCEIFNIKIDDLLKEEKEDYDVSKINILNCLREQKEMKLKGNLYYDTQITFAYNTNHIEGSRLTEDQTRFIYETNSILPDGNTVISIDDILETTNHFKLVDYMLDIADEKLTEDIIKNFHKILKTGTSDSMKSWFNVGEYKKLNNEVGVIKTSLAKNVKRDILNLMDWYNSLDKVTIKEIIEFHARFEKIHPFQDGNGRIGRIIAFKECLKNNIVPFIILDRDKLFYYRGLKEYQLNKEKGYLIDTCLNAQDQYLEKVKYYLK